MKHLRILLACLLTTFATVSLVRAEDSADKKDAPACGGCPAQKQEEAKCHNDVGCTGGACTKSVAKPEKTDAPKAP